MAKFFKYSLLIILSIASLQIAMADDNDLEKPKQSVRLSKQIQSNNGSPRTIPMLYLDGTYSIGYIEFALPSEVNYAEVTLGSDENTVVWSGIITPDFPGCETPDFTGEYFVTCTLDNGATYQGVITY